MKNRVKRNPSPYPKKKVSNDQIRDAIEAVKIWGVPLIVKTINNEVYKIVDKNFYDLIAINGERISIYSVIDYFLFPRPPVY